MKRQALAAIGLLDENYFSYFEDTDYCFRAIEKGYRVVCCGSVTIVHHEHVSTTVNQVKHEKMFKRAQKVFRGKWERKLQDQRYTRELGWHSIFNFSTGYAISSRQLACALDRKAFHVAYNFVYFPGTVFPLRSRESPDRHLSSSLR